MFSLFLLLLYYISIGGAAQNLKLYVFIVCNYRRTFMIPPQWKEIGMKNVFINQKNI
jgi:hypothetical protein